MEKRLPLPAGTVLQGRYRIMRQLGHGGFGAVYEAVDDEIGKSFALKETFYAANEELRQAFKREARMLASLEHEAFPDVSHYFTEGDGCFLVMELIRGDDLDKLLSQRPAPFEQQQVLTWADQILDALGDLHSGGIIHRDLKPSNLKLTPKGRIKLLDFGIAKGALEGETTVLTTVGSLAAATLQYAPLEQVLKASTQYQMMLSVVSPDKVIEILKQGTNAASDLYALAATLYQLLTKTLPADAATRAISIWSEKPDPLVPAQVANPQISTGVSEVLQKALRLDRNERYQTASEMQSGLRAAVTDVTAPTQRAVIEPLPTVEITDAQVTLPSPRSSEAETIKIVPATTDVLSPLAQPKAKEKTAGRKWIYAGAGGLCLLLIAGFLVYFAAIKTRPSANISTANKNAGATSGKPLSDGPFELAQTITGNGHVIYAVAFSPDGKSVASNAASDTVNLWDPSTGALQQTLVGHSGSVYEIAFSPDGTLIATGSEDKTIKLWNAKSGILVRTLTGHSDAVIAVVFSPDGKTLASGNRGLEVKLWDVASGTLKQSLTGHTHYVTSVAFSPDGRTIASGSLDDTIKLWDVTSGALKQTLTGSSSSVSSAVFSPDGRTIANGRNDTIELWETASGSLKQTLTGKGGSVNSVVFSPDGKIIAGNFDRTIKLFDLAGGKLRQTLSGHTGVVYALAFSPDGRTIASGSYDLTVKLWRVKE